MSVLVYRRKSSTGAADLAEALDAVRFRGRTRTIEQKVKNGDIVINWGETYPGKPGVRVLNSAPLRTKYQDATALQAAGVSTIQVALQKPTLEATAITPVDPAVAAWEKARDMAEDFTNTTTGNLRSPIFRQGVTELANTVQTLWQTLQVPAPVAIPIVPKVWIPRKNDHVGGNDLLGAGTTPVTADYWVVKEDLVKEFRIHSFLGKSIRAGVKALRDDFRETQPGINVVGGQYASPWIRSWDGGWRIKYDGVSSRKRHRELAHAAVKALGLDFGAVDIGERADGTLIVLEVNRAPGLAEGTIDRYADAISRWIAGETTTEEGED